VILVAFKNSHLSRPGLFDLRAKVAARVDSCQRYSWLESS